MNDAPKTILITGTSYGLGQALAQGMIDRGHVVFGCSRSRESVDQMCERWPAPSFFYTCDVSKDDDVRRWAEVVLAERDAPDVIVNNAAVGPSQSVQLWKASAEDFRRVLATNVEGQANVIRHFVPAMLRRRKGVIVNVSSGWGRDVAAKESLYCASKWAVEGMTRAFALELLPTMAAVSLHPGIINTPLLQRGFGEDAFDYPTPEEWAKAAVPFILQLGPKDNGEPLEVPGMPAFKTPRRLRKGAGLASGGTREVRGQEKETTRERQPP